MKLRLRSVLPLCAAALLASCGGLKKSKTTAEPMPATHGEFDPTTGTWKPVSKIVAAPPPQGGAVITPTKKPGMMDSMQKSLKKPLKWVGLSKDEPAPANTPAPATSTAKPKPSSN